LNNYYCAISDAAAVLSGGYIYSKVGLKMTYYIAFTLGLIGGLGILYIEILMMKLHNGSNQLTLHEITL
jgi:hypothetical protein